MRRATILIIFIVGCIAAMSQTNQPQVKDPAEMMREMRLKMLTTPPGDFDLKPSPQFPKVCGVVMDWPVGPQTITLVSLATGDASIYTTGTFGVIGGIGHESVRSAAKACVKSAQKYYADAMPTKEFPYPATGHVRFYLVCYDGVRMLDADLDATRNGHDKTSDLYIAAQRVITELRLTTEKQKREKP